MEENEYYIEDIESGVRIKVNRDQHDRYQKALQYFRPNLTGINTVLVYGTSGELDNNTDLKDIFFSPDKYKFT
jgi:hypothetical protein